MWIELFLVAILMKLISYEINVLGVTQNLFITLHNNFLQNKLMYN